MAEDRPVYRRNFTPEQIQAKREYVAEYQRRKRASQRDVKLRPPKDPARRLECEASPILWMRTYCPDKFFNPFTEHQEEIVSDLHYTLNHGGDKALADIRGGGKTSMTEAYCGGYRTLTQEKQYGVIISKNSPNARTVLSSIIAIYEKEQGPLIQDYPEVVLPIMALEGATSRGRMQTVGGVRTHIVWTGDILQFPIVYPEWCRDCYRKTDVNDPFCEHCGSEWMEEIEDVDDNGKSFIMMRPRPSRASGNCIASFGIDAAFVGLKRGSLRPTYAIIDDVETEDSALNPDQVEKKEKIIENSIGGLAGPTTQFSRIILCTVRGAVSLAAKFTDTQEKPAWRGKRYSQVQSFPDNEDLWKEYIFLRKKSQRDGDARGEEANAFYATHRELMDAGVKVLNPYRFVAKDGEVSAIQHFYNQVARKGWSFVIPEYQNQIYIDDEETCQLPDPAFLLTKWHRDYDKDIVYRTGFIDVSKRVLWWAVCGWSRDYSGRVLDYGIFPEQRGYEVTREITDTLPGATEDERLLLIKDYADFLKDKYSLSRCGVDIGYRDDIITPQCDGNMILACRGQPSGVHTKPIHEVEEKRPTDVVRDNWRLRFLSNDAGTYRVLQFDSDFWKAVVHDKLSAQPQDLGTLMLPPPPKRNEELILHLLSEKRSLVPGRYRQFWKYEEPTSHNHWLDCVSGCTVLASTLGLTLNHTEKPIHVPKSWREIAAKQREKHSQKQIDKDRIRKRAQRSRRR